MFIYRVFDYPNTKQWGCPTNLKDNPIVSWKLYNKRDFKACEARKTAAYLGVCEDFEGECNAAIKPRAETAFAGYAEAER